MPIYRIDGIPLSQAFDYEASQLQAAFSISGEQVFSGDRKPIKTYDYASDPDPDKSYTWTYDLAALQEFQGNKFTIGIQTDTHYLPSQHNATYVTPLKNMTKQLYFDFIINMGDIPRGWANDTTSNTKSGLTEMMRRYTSYVESPVLIAVGNHDNANNYAIAHNRSMTEVISRSDLYSAEIGGVKSTTDIVEPTEHSFYYYKDFPECRVIVLDTNDYPYLEVSDYDVHGNHHTISEAQINWFANTALNTDKPVLVISHAPLTTAIRPEEFVAPEEDKAYSYATIPYRADRVLEELKSFADNGGVVIACFCGHTHRQLLATVNGVKHICFANGGKYAEIVFIDLGNRTITTKVIGSDKSADYGATAADRAFAF